MNNKFLFLLAGLWLSLAPVFAQHTCNHRVSFEKSSLSDSLDVISYHIYLDSIIWDGDLLYARTQVVLKSKLDGLMVVPLELLSMGVTEVLINGIATENYVQTENRLNISLSEALNAEEEAELWISYNGTPFKEGWGGFYIDNQYAYNLGVGFDADPHNLGKAWFPCVDDFHDRAVYDVTARVEDPLVAVAGGLLMEVTDHGDGTKSYHWHLRRYIRGN